MGYLPSCSPRYPDEYLELRWPAPEDAIKILCVSDGQELVYRFKATIEDDDPMTIFQERDVNLSLVRYFPLPAWSGIISVIEDNNITLIGPIPAKYWKKFMLSGNVWKVK